MNAATDVVPATAPPVPATLATVPSALPTAIALYLDNALYERVSSVAQRMSKAAGVTPKHLIAAPEACFAVVSRAITWRLDPFAVAMATYQTPGGQIGFEGKLVHAIIENSGRLDPAAGGIRYEHYGDWSKVQGKFTIRESQNEKKTKYAAPTWTDDDARAGKPADQVKYPLAQSCGVRVIAQIRGERDPRILDFDLIQAQPRNSTLWATDPMTQICYTAVRRFGSLVVSSLLMGVPFDPVDYAPQPGEVDITPKRGTDTSSIDAINNEVAGEGGAGAGGEQGAAPATDLAGGFTYAQVADAIEKAKDGDTFNLAVDMIRGVADAGQRDELTALATKRREAIAK